MTTELDTTTQMLLVIVALIVIVAVTVGLTVFFFDFSKELRYLNNEIRRTDREERRYWIGRKRRLWLSLLPFIKY